MILLLYKKTYFNAHDLDHCLSSVCVFILQDFKNIFPNEIPDELSLIKGVKRCVYYSVFFTTSVIAPCQSIKETSNLLSPKGIIWVWFAYYGMLNDIEAL
jgi:hypothetical protein